MSQIVRKFMVIATSDTCKCRVTAYRFAGDDRIQLLTVYQCTRSVRGEALNHDAVIKQLEMHAAANIAAMALNYEAGASRTFDVPTVWAQEEKTPG